MKLDAQSAGWNDAANRDPYRMEIVDPVSPDWPGVLAAVIAAGQAHVLRVNEGGWLSARQCVAAAFDGDSVVGFVVFHVELFRSSSGGLRLQPNGVGMQAVIDVATTEAQHRSIAATLVQLARSYAHSTLRCVEFDQQWLAA